MTGAEKRRLLHLIRGELPASVVAEGDILVYATGDPPGFRLGAPEGEPVDAARIVELIFEADTAAVW